jgi:myo-inositol-1(or 4)-monophosphatase
MQPETAAMLPHVVAAVRQAGRFQLAHFREHPPGGGTAKAAKEYVSHVDVETERSLRQALACVCPPAGFYGEELGSSGDRRLQWIVDPLDGTTNYLSGLPYFSVSVALVRDGRPELAVVFKPWDGELFTACRGQGARRDGRPLPRAGLIELGEALIGTGFPYRSADLRDGFFGCAREVLDGCRGIRRFGSAALDLAYVAAGYLQGFWESDLEAYDVAAGLLLLEETGCEVYSWNRETYDPFASRLLVAGWPGVAGPLTDLATRHYRSLATDTPTP